MPGDLHRPTRYAYGALTGFDLGHMAYVSSIPTVRVERSLLAGFIYGVGQLSLQYELAIHPHGVTRHARTAGYLVASILYLDGVLGVMLPYDQYQLVTLFYLKSETAL